MKKFPLLTCAVLCAALAIGCKPDLLGPTGIQLDLLTADSRLYASYFVLTWLDDQGPLFEARVPDGDALIDVDQAPAVSVFIALDANNVGTRRVVVRGYGSDGQNISLGAAKLDAHPDVWVNLGVPMRALGALPDQDGDGIPDSIDNCPRERDPCGGTPVEADAGAPPADAGPDLAPDLGVERAPVLPTNLTDAGADLTSH
jgi:hypothetical protein